MKIVVSIFFAFIIWPSGCTEKTVSDEPILINLKGKSLGTTWTVKVLTDIDLDQKDLRTDIVEKLEQTDKIFSHWRP
ncbi:MAG: hypothetical protein QNL65_07100, partial [Opitutales bacterium]